MDLIKYVTVMYCIFMLTWANLKRCSEKHDDLAVCLKEGDFDPFPITVNTLLYLEEIIGIDHNKNSINVGVKLWAHWKNPRLSLSNNSAS